MSKEDTVDLVLKYASKLRAKGVDGTNSEPGKSFEIGALLLVYDALRGLDATLKAGIERWEAVADPWGKYVDPVLQHQRERAKEADEALQLEKLKREVEALEAQEKRFRGMIKSGLEAGKSFRAERENIKAESWEDAGHDPEMARELAKVELEIEDREKGGER